MTDSRNKYLLKNTIIFTVGNLATKLISFFLIPLYTNILTTEEYGTIDLIVTICTIAIPLMTLNVMESVMRFNLDKDQNKDIITKNGLIVVAIGCIVGLVMIPLLHNFKSISDLSLLTYLYVISSAWCQLFLADLRGKEKLIYYNIGNVINTLLIAVFNIVFLKYFGWGLKGYLAAFTLSNTIVATFSMFAGKSFKSVYVKMDNSKLLEMLKYSIVLIPNSFMWWIMNSSDHLMVTAMVGVAANGIYAISYKLPTLISTFTGIFNQAWSYSAIREEGAEDEEQYSNRVLHTMIAFVIIIGIVLMTLVKPFLKIYVAADYYSSWKYTPFLIIGCVYLTFATFMSTSYSVHKDSMGFLISGGFGATLNLVLNYILIPHIGVYGAACATCLSYVSVFIFRAIHTRKYIKYHVLTREFCVGTVLLILSGILVYIEKPIAFYSQWIITIFVVYLFRANWYTLIDGVISRLKGLRS